MFVEKVNERRLIPSNKNKLKITFVFRERENKQRFDRHNKVVSHGISNLTFCMLQGIDPKK